MTHSVEIANSDVILIKVIELILIAVDNLKMLITSYWPKCASAQKFGVGNAGCQFLVRYPLLTTSITYSN